MPALPDCPAPEEWAALFDDALPAGRRDEYERHLQTCAVCQERLDRAECDADDLQRLGRSFGDPTMAPSDPGLIQVLDRLRTSEMGERAEVPEPTELYFLQPTERTDILGMLGHYEVQEVIGEGGMGVVLKAFEPALHRLVAIKVMSPALAGSATARRRFTREAKTAAAVCHDHIVAVHGVNEESGLPYLVMQYVPGESLQARIDRLGPLDLKELVHIGLQTASGLAAAHTRGLIHRDIKPANLLLSGEGREAGGEEMRGEGQGARGEGKQEEATDSGESLSSLVPRPSSLAPHVKITDFGLARSVDEVGLTRNGAVAGTPEYMAPEQARGDAVDHRADLFSLGSVLYAMCTGVPPFRGSTAFAVLRQVNEQMPEPIRSLNADVPVWLEELIGRLMAKNPEDRFQTAAEVADLLEGYLAHLRQPEMVAPPGLRPLPPEFCAEPPSSRSRGRLATWLRPRRVVALVALAALGVGLFLLLQTVAPRPDEDKAKNLAGWGAVTDPSDDCTFTTEKSRLVIKVPGGIHNLNPNRGMQAPRVLKTVKGDFVAQIKVTGDFKPGEKAADNQRLAFNGAGVLVWQDEKNYIRLERNCWYVPEAQKYACFPPLLEYHKNGKYQDTGLNHSTLDEFFKGRSTWLRLERNGDKVIASYSHDGKEWTEAKEITVDLSAELSVGVAAINTSAEAFTVEFDEYKVEENAGPFENGDIHSGPPKAEYAQEYFHSFKRNAGMPAGWALQGNEAAECVRLEGEGLRLTPRRSGIGTRSEFGVKGNFEITLGFEILNEPTAQEAGPNTRLSLLIWKETPRKNAATINRGIDARDGRNFVTWQSVWNDDLGKPVPRIDTFPTQAKSGKLRLVRFGRHLYYGFAEGLNDDFNYRAKYDFGPEDLREVRIVAATGAETASFDARVLDVWIRADGLTNKPAAAQAKVEDAAPAGAPADAPQPGGWLTAGVLMGGTTILIFGIVAGIGLIMRGRLSGTQSSEAGFPGRLATWLRPPRLAALAALTVLGVCLFLLVQAAPPPPKQASVTEFYCDFRGGGPLPSFLTLHGSEADHAIKREEQGLRITLPARRRPNAGVGVLTTLPIAGDFEITGTYELLSADRPKGGNGVSVALNITTDNDMTKFAKVSRCLRPEKGDVYQTEFWMKDQPDSGEHFFVPTTARAGRLRLVREGSTLRFLVAEGAGNEFEEINRREFTTEDMELVRFVANNGGAAAGIDVRLIDLRVRSQPAQAKGWLTSPLVVAVGFILALLLSALGVLLHVGRRPGTLGEEKPGPAAPEAATLSIAFPCPGCGRKLRARAALAGKSVKCPQCGQRVLAPETNPGSFVPRASTDKSSILKKNRAVIASVLVLAVVTGVCMLFWPRRVIDYSFLNGTVGNQLVPEVQDSGFYQEEYSKAGRPFRWTDGKGRLVIPIDRRKPPTGLFVELDVRRPEGVKTAWVQIVANNRVLFRQQIPLLKWQGDSAGRVDKSLDLTGIDLGDELVLDIVSDTFIPKRDQRTLGVLVMGIELRHEAPQ